ncbi:alpha/beta hydrolase [Streptomyces sp. MZ04]|uniref:alpha/beta hydrolase n=1 Tax=Streptomyces sp. MZ04 TaxID=2559236 RepID=UPI00107E7178|nr:alpha/beta hydrolase [Streptomyces sp. MZ04]TGB14816.1 alpha/beta hydrolase [Streptomyces sp. MZ04]
MTPHAVVDLTAEGELLDPDTGGAVPPVAVPGFLARHLRVPESATDIVVFVHGWRNSPAGALSSARRLFTLVETVHADRPGAYPALGPWSAHYVLVRWPSMSNPLPHGYRRIRDRAHAMTTRGRAAEVMGQLLGYLNEHRRLPGAPPTLRTSSGQYLHSIGHSFGGRFLVEAVQAAADARPPVLGWNRSNPRYPHTLDTLLIFQMAASPGIFADRFRRILHDAPINGPVVLTHSRADRATGLWHRLAEGTPGIGYAGVAEPSERIGSLPLRRLEVPYRRHELDHRLVNIDAHWRYRRGRLWNPAGAHSDFCHAESAHLLLSLACLAR